jgi:hypothetical protein
VSLKIAIMTTVYFKTGTIIRENQLTPTAITGNPGKERIFKNKQTWWGRFLAYSATQQANRFGWLALAFTLQGCVMAPVTICAIVFNGNSIVLWMTCTLSFAITEVTNLAAMPTRVTIPILFGGIVLDLLVIAASFIPF